MPDPARQAAATLMNPLTLNGGRAPTFVTGNYSIRKDDGWIVVIPQIATGTITIQLPADPDPGATYFVSRGLIFAAAETGPVDVVVVGNPQQAASGGYDTIYGIGANLGGYHISRFNETVGFGVSTQQPNFAPHPYTDWFAFGGLGFESYSAAFVPNLAGAVTVPLAGFALGNGGGDGGHPRSLYGVSLVVSPPLSAGNLKVSPRFNGVAAVPDLLDLNSATQPAASRFTAGSPIAGTGVDFFTAPPGSYLMTPPAAGGILDVVITGSGGAAGPTAGVVTALVF
jgi:hypothetical protein